MTDTPCSPKSRLDPGMFEHIQRLEAWVPPLPSVQDGGPWIRRAAIARSSATCLQRCPIPLSGRPKMLHPVISHVLTRALKGFPGGSVVKNPPATQEMQVRSLPWRRKWQPTLVFLPGKYHGQRRAAGSGPWGSQKKSNRTQWRNEQQQRTLSSPWSKSPEMVSTTPFFKYPQGGRDSYRLTRVLSGRLIYQWNHNHFFLITHHVARNTPTMLQKLLPLIFIATQGVRHACPYFKNASTEAQKSYEMQWLQNHLAGVAVTVLRRKRINGRTDGEIDRQTNRHRWQTR